MITIPAPVRASSPAAPPLAKAGPLGPGAGVLMTEYHVGQVLGQDQQRRMAKALQIGQEVDWIVAAERVIASKLAGCEWHLEDDQGETIDDEWKGNPLAQAARALVDDPQGGLPIAGPDAVGRRMSRRQFLTVTSGEMGLAGNAGWYLDMVDGLGLPHALVPISPDRLSAECDSRGVLVGWTLDRRPGAPGTPIEVDRLVLNQLIPPFKGVFGRGLVEAALAKAVNSGLVDAHYTSLLRSGGRISGILSPKDQPITDDTQFQQLINDWRNIVEQPEAARRLQVVRAPVEFTSTVMGVGEMQAIDLIYQNRDALLALWGVPLSQLGGTAASGLNSGETRKYDEASLWQAAVHDRIVEMRESLQSILDLWEPHLGWAPTICFDEPEFDDATPAYDRAQKAANLPLRNVERRAIVGLDPFGDPALDNAVWMPMTVSELAMAPDEDGRIPTPTPGVSPAPVPDLPPLPTFAGKAMPVATNVRRYRERVQDRVTPRLRAAVREALSGQRDAIAAAVERNWDAIGRKQNDDTAWWREGDMGRVLRTSVSGVSRQAAEHVSGVVGG